MTLTKDEEYTETIKHIVNKPKVPEELTLQPGFYYYVPWDCDNLSRPSIDYLDSANMVAVGQLGVNKDVNGWFFEALNTGPEKIVTMMCYNLEKIYGSKKVYAGWNIFHLNVPYGYDYESYDTGKTYVKATKKTFHVNTYLVLGFKICAGKIVDSFSEECGDDDGLAAAEQQNQELAEQYEKEHEYIPEDTSKEPFIYDAPDEGEDEDVDTKGSHEPLGPTLDPVPMIPDDWSPEGTGGSSSEEIKTYPAALVAFVIGEDPTIKDDCVSTIIYGEYSGSRVSQEEHDYATRNKGYGTGIEIVLGEPTAGWIIAALFPSQADSIDSSAYYILDINWDHIFDASDVVDGTKAGTGEVNGTVHPEWRGGQGPSWKKMQFSQGMSLMEITVKKN